MISSVDMRFVGVVPLLLQNPEGADPLNPLVQEIKKVTGKTTKTSEDHAVIAALEFRLHLYLDEEKRVVIPAPMLEAVIRAGAKKRKKGKDVERGVQITRGAVLEYDGPQQDPDALYAAGFYDRRSVVIKQNRVMRVRPRFDQWSLQVTCLVDTEVLDPEKVVEFAELGGKYDGIGTYRPRHGRFSVEVLNVG